MTVDPADVRVLAPRIRRSLEGSGAPPSLTDDEIKDVTADAIAEIVLYAQGSWDVTLGATSTDPDTGAPSEYATSRALTLTEAAVVASQTALNYFFFLFAGLKVSESISDESETWSYDRSAQLLQKQLQLLIDERNKALSALEREDVHLDTYISYLETRDQYTAFLIEPYTSGAGGVGGIQQDPSYRFPG